MASMQRYIDKAKKDLGDFNVPDRTPSSKTEKDSRLKILKDAASGEYKVGKKKVSKGRIVEMKKGGKVSPPKKRGDIGQKVFLSKVAKQMKESGQPFGGKAKKKAEGGSLKAVPSENTGLGKLPTPVRNKMGYMKKGGIVKNLSEADKKQYDKLLKRAKSMQSQGNLMSKDLNNIKSRVGESLGEKPYALTANIKKELNDHIRKGKNPKTQMNKGSDDLKKIVSRMNKEYTALRKSAGMLPERNMKVKKKSNGGIVKMQGGGAATRGTNFNRGH